jgi:hypothetical protein
MNREHLFVLRANHIKRATNRTAIERRGVALAQS